jgi:hypothetical protein
VTNNLCKLCLKNEAGNQHSHIIPRFLTESLYWENGKNQKGKTLKLVNGKMVKTEKSFEQDALKEPKLFCGRCEKYFEILDTHFCNFIYKPFRNEKNITEYFKVITLRHQIAFCELADDRIVSLFLFSILFRCNESSLSFCIDFHINKDDYKKIRDLLMKYHTFLKGNDLLEKVKNFPVTTLFPYLVFTVSNNTKLKMTDNIVDICYRRKNGIYLIAVNDYIFTIYSNMQDIPFAEGINNNIERTKIIILTDDVFKDIQSFGIKKYLQYWNKQES